MKTMTTLLLLTLMLPIALAQAGPVSNAFTYQGWLEDNGQPITGQVDLQVYLYDAELGGSMIAGGYQFQAVDVDQGAFTVLLDWAPPNWDGNERWLDIHVRNPHDPGDTGAFTQLDPRQRITVVPYAIHALNGGGGGGGSGFWEADETSISNNNGGFVGINRSWQYAPGEVFGLYSWDEGLTGMTVIADNGPNTSPMYGLKGLYFESRMYLSPMGTLGFFNSGQNMYFTIDGKLGVGTEFPGSTVTANGMVESLSGGFKFPDGTIQTTAGGGGGGGPTDALILTDSNALDTVELLASTGPGTADGPTLKMYNTLGQGTVNLFGGKNGGGSLFMDGSDGTLGLRLHAATGFGDFLGGSRIEMYRADGTQTLVLHADYNDTGESRVVANVVEITGGSDLSEHFDVAAGARAVDPGSVVCIDPSSPGDLRMSTTAYDRKVAGIISGADGVKPGLLMSQKGTVADGEYPVALTGRVYCKVDASYGPIEPGDLLTTSATPGHAMKVTDHGEAQGAILGKAMTALEAGQGMVLVLVSLQ